MKRLFMCLAAAVASVAFLGARHALLQPDTTNVAISSVAYIGIADQDSPDSQPPQEYWTLFTAPPSSLISEFKDNSPSGDSQSVSSSGTATASPASTLKRTFRFGLYSLGAKPSLRTASIIAFRKLLI